MQGLTVAHIPNLDPEQWRIAHELGAVPGGTPYGLHKLAQYKLRVDFEAVHSAGRDPRKWAPAIVKKHLSRARIQHDGPHHHAAITWDERGAAGVYARHSGNYRRLGSGVIWATDQYDKRTNSYRLKALRTILREFDFIWCLSRGQLPALQKWLGVPHSKLHFVPFGIDTDFFRTQPWIDKPMLLSLGNDRDRDISTLYQALQRVSSRLPNIDIVVQTRSTLTPPEGVVVHRHLDADRVRELYARATLLVIATRPNLHISGMTTILEAMAIGRPVVINQTPGIEDYVHDEHTGRLVTAGDPVSFARVVLDLLDDTEKLSAMGMAAANYVRNCHTESTMCSALASIVKSE